jgi:hypothetical protein
MSKQREIRREKKKYSQASWLETPEELQLNDNHEKLLFFAVLLLFAQRKTRFW